MGQKKKTHYYVPLNIRRLSPRQMGDENYLLSTYYRFDSVDLQANIEGNITNFQLERLGEIWWNKFWGLVLGLPLILVFGYGCFGMTMIPIMLEQDHTWAYCFGLSGVYLIAYVVHEAWHLVQLARDAKQHQIYSVTGKAKMWISWFTWGAEVMHLDGVRFVVLPKQTGCTRIFIKADPIGSYSYPFKENQWYTVYYLPHSKTIISAEISRPEDFDARLEESVITMGADGEIELT
ncbi:MAG: hypothetical protein HY862_04975 [Chloroflexi bacterium]|nr:hypothetical protein [Chloroflexota bacterium]